MKREGRSFRVLFITRSFPPDEDIGGRRIAFFCKHLPEFGGEPFVLAKNGTRSSQSEWVTRVAPWKTPLDWRAKKAVPQVQPSVPATSIIKTNQPKKTGTLRDFAGNLLQTPDRSIGWYIPASRAAARMIRAHRIDAVVTSGPPWTTLLIGRRLKRKFPHLVWVADFRDPWTVEVMRSSLPDWRKRLEERMQVSCLRAADVATCTTASIGRELVATGATQTNRVVVITNGFDVEVTESKRPSATSKHFRLMHLGTLYGSRRIDTLCRAIQLLHERKQVEAGSILVEFIGDCDPNIGQAAREAASELFAHGLIKIIPKVTSAEARQLLRAADALLLVQGEHVHQVPAKFYDYLQVPQPMMAVAAKGALTQLLDETGAGIWAGANDVEEIAAAVQKLMSGMLPERISAVELNRRFHARYLTESLMGVIRASSARG